MQKITEAARLCLYFAGIVLIFALTRLVAVATQDTHAAAVRGQHVLDNAVAITAEARAAVTDQRKGVKRTMEVTFDAIHAYANLAQDIHQTAFDERDAIQQAGDEFVKFSQHMNQVAQSVDRETTDIGMASVNAINSLQPAVQQAQFTFGAIQRDADDAHARIMDPKIDLMLADSQMVTHNAAVATTDGQVYMHNALFPIKQHGWARFGTDVKGTGRLAWAACRITGYCPSF